MTSASAVSGELRQVTVVFSDLSGFTAMSERLDPEDVQDVTEQVFGAARGVIESYGGRVDKLLGDAVMAVFGDPVAHEDDAERAVRAALGVHRAVGDLSPSVEARTGFALTMHTGINTGVVVTGRRDSDHLSAGPLGDTINLASRLQGLAEAGDILLGPDTTRLVAGVFDLEDLGARDVKGKTGRVAVNRVVGIASTRTAPSRRHGDFVGRQEELGALLGAVERVRDGAGGVITVVGEAGAGKTRLLAEVQARIGDDVQWLEGRAYAYGERTPYAPVIDLISRVVGIEEGDTPEKVRLRLEEAVAALVDDDVHGVVSPLLRLYSVETPDEAAQDREAFQDRLLHSTTRLVGALGERGPTVLCLQDLHWADPPSVSLVRHVADRLRSTVLFVLNTRPGFELGAGERMLDLGDLSARQTRQLVASLLGTSDPPPEVLEFVEARADGNPFFVEEVLNSLIESGVVVEADGEWRAVERIDAAAVPPTIRGVIAARIDRLDDTRRRVLQEASVVGREFLYRVVNEVSASGPELAPSLSLLERADLIRERTADPDLEYLFKHALTQEVAYAGLVKRERQQLHERVAHAIETQLGHRIGEFTEVLAHHWARAGISDQAVQYLRLAGAKAVERYAVEEADHFYTQAYELLADRERTPAEDRTLCEMLVEWMVVQYYRADFPRVVALLERHEDDFVRVGDPGLSGMALAWRGNAESILMHLERAFALLDDAISIGQRHDDATVLAHAITWKAWALFFAGRMAETVDIADELPPLIERLPDDRYVVLKSQGAVALAHATLGNVEETRRIADELQYLGERTGSARALSIAHSVRCCLGMLTGDWDGAIEEGTAAVRVVRDPMYHGIASATVVNVLAVAGRTEELRAALDATPHRDDLMGELHRWAEGLCLVSEGKLSEGMRLLERCRQRGLDTGVEWAVVVTDLYITSTYARIATGEATAPASVILRNPAFVVRHAVPARRKARRALEAFERDHVEGRGLEGTLFAFDYERAKFLAHEGDIERSKRAAERALQASAAYGDSEGRRAISALLDRLQERSGPLA
jgi:class 3 adenylate cyclase/tetratricopeptide (TPR) repeat protein